MALRPLPDNDSDSAPGAPEFAVLTERVDDLTASVIGLDQAVRARPLELTLLPPLLEALVSRLGDICQSLRGLQAEDARATAEAQALRGQQKEQADALRDVQARLTHLADSAPPAGAVERLATLEKRIESQRRRHERQMRTSRDRLVAIETRIETLGQNLRPAAEAPQSEMAGSLIRGHLEAPYPARSDNEKALSASPQRPLAESQCEALDADESIVQLFRQESIGVAMASVNDLYQRVDRLDRQEEALSRIISLLVDRSKLIGDNRELQQTRVNARGRWK